MGPHASVHVVAVFSHQRATADFLKRALDSAGFASFTAPDELARVDTFLHAIQPHAVVVDMASATEAAWQELMRLRSSPTWDDNVALVLTTADGSGLRRWMTGPRSGEAAVVVGGQHFGQQDDGVEGGTQFVGHIGQELRPVS